MIDEIILADGITFILLYRKLKNTEKCILQNNSTPLGGFFAIKMIKLSQLREKHCPNCRRNYKNTEKNIFWTKNQKFPISYLHCALRVTAFE